MIADTLSRITGAITPRVDLYNLHNSLCHPGVTRMHHWVCWKNLPFSLEDIKKVTNSCLIRNELKPRFVKNVGTLVKATAPFERLNLDFKGPLPSVSRNPYILTLVDEFSRFPFAIPCSDISAKTIILHLKNIFSIFGMPSFIHSDRGSSFMSHELKSFLTSQGIATSCTTPYNPAGNGQVER
ncbi:putative retrovirus-related pol polyprotein from transposon opus [Trichonephila clavipes]|nr:putative retrovirus-related pol polyprotein from transposon opus [Trichonephila clavipes]